MVIAYRFDRSSSRILLISIVMLLSLLTIAELLFARSSYSFWPFTSEKERWVAKVGDEIITLNTFIEAMNVLHTSNYVGRELSKESSFQKQNYKSFLDDLVDEKLMRMEAENLSLHEEHGFIAKMNTFILNQKLERLRQDEIVNKVKVKGSEIRQIYEEEHIDKSQLTDEEIDSLEMPRGIRASIKADLTKIKTEDMENAFFSGIRARAEITIEGDTFLTVSADDPTSYEKIVATVNGEPITGRTLLQNLRDSHNDISEEKKRGILDQLILYKAIDQEAMSRPYEVELELKDKIKKFRDDLLEKAFKIKVILPSIVVSDEEIVDHYENNLSKFKGSDSVDVSVIVTYKKDEAENILSELKKGADFTFLAKRKSVDASGKRGGQVGWTNMNIFPAKIRDILYDAKGDDIVGPFMIDKNYAVAKFNSLKKGAYRQLDKNLKAQIDKKLGREKFNIRLNEYLRRLRDVVPVKFNQKELALLSERT